MNNFWIAALEYVGVLTHEQAEDLANNIKNSIHNEKYIEAFAELKTILDVGPGSNIAIVSKLETAFDDLKAQQELQMGDLNTYIEDLRTEFATLKDSLTKSDIKK